MLGGLGIAVFVSCVVAAGVMWAALARLSGLAAFLLTAYLAVWLQLVMAGVLLTGLGALSPLGYLVFSAVSALTALAVWHRSGRPRPQDFGVRLSAVVGILRDPPLAVLAVAALVTYAYVIAVAIGVPQNDWDPLAYELSRAAFWRQTGGLSIVSGTTELRLNVNPVGAELGLLATMVLSGTERFVWLVQASAAATLSIAAVALARRLGRTARQSVIAGLLVLAIPIVVVQATTAYNDLVLASFVLCAAVFGMGKDRRELVPLGVSVGLAVATKFTAPLLLPLALALALSSQRLRRWPELAAASAVGALAGAGWHVVNIVRVGSPDGGLADHAGQHAPSTVGGVILNAQRLLLQTLEIPGTNGNGALVMCGVGLAVAVLAAPVAIRRSRVEARPIVYAGVLLAALPFLVISAFAVLRDALAGAWEAIGNDDASRLIGGSLIQKNVDGSLSWAGPVGLACALASGMITLRSAVRRRSSPAVAVAALAPLIGIAILAALISYDPWRGRFLVSAWVMSIATWGVLCRYRTITWLLAITSTVTMGLAALQWTSRPSGIDALAGRPVNSIWSLPRWEVQTALRTRDERGLGQALMIRWAEEQIPPDTPVAVAVYENDFLFPYFGEALGRRLFALDGSAKTPAAARWLVVAPELQPRACASAWAQTYSHRSGWRIYQRTGPDTCHRVVPLIRRPRDVPYSTTH